METARRSQVHSQRTVHCPSAAALSYAGDFFAQEEVGAEVRLPLDALIPRLPGALTYPVRFHFSLREDQSEQGRVHEEIAFSWNAGTFWLPDFRGSVRVHIAPHVQAEVLLEGSYVPPFGFLGTIFDRIIGRRFAERTIQCLIDRVAEYLESQERAFNAAHTHK